MRVRVCVFMFRLPVFVEDRGMRVLKFDEERLAAAVAQWYSRGQLAKMYMNENMLPRKPNLSTC